jgi:hypothetical protein
MKIAIYAMPDGKEASHSCYSGVANLIQFTTGRVNYALKWVTKRDGLDLVTKSTYSAGLVEGQGRINKRGPSFSWS